MRLASRERAPQPTLVTTGTGSGKTESFLVPLLDHCHRQRRAGQRGIKALVLYPMNALANVQARRVAQLVHQHGSELSDVTVGRYTGDSDGGVAMTETSVIADKYALRKNPLDIVLTNYKMLDMLLLRSEDTPLFADAGESLQYLVLDEFHTYDGAQGPRRRDAAAPAGHGARGDHRRAAPRPPWAAGPTAGRRCGSSRRRCSARSSTRPR